jgi:protein tyrosine/serine phosphatase
MISILQWPKPRRAFAAIGVGLALAVTTVSGVVAEAVLSNNFHVVVPGELYRSAQPDAGFLARVHAEAGIRTVINLRGANPEANWYRQETAEAERLGVRVIDFKMKASRDLTPTQAQSLIEVMRDAPKPLLIHCQSGVDRTGLAAALYLAAVKNDGEAAAEWQMSLRFGHVSLPFLAGYAMDRTFERLEPGFGYSGS